MTMHTPDTPTASLPRPGHGPGSAGRNSGVPEAEPHWLSDLLALIGVVDEPWADRCAVRQSRLRSCRRGSGFANGIVVDRYYGSAVPESGTLALMLAGLGTVASLSWRRRAH